MRVWRAPGHCETLWQ